MSQIRLAAPLRRQHILDGALPVFSAHGFHDTSMNDIAEAVGVTKPVIYQHFGSKRKLFAALIDTVGNDMVETVKTATQAATDGKAQTQRGFQAYFHWVDTPRRLSTSIWWRSETRRRVLHPDSTDHVLDCLCRCVNDHG